MHQCWYDNPQSLSIKYNYAVQNKMRGVGMWEADDLDYSNTQQGAKMRQEMWGAMPKY